MNAFDLPAIPDGGGELHPYTPEAPQFEPPWLVPDVDHLSENYGEIPQLFGQPLPSGIVPADVQQQFIEPLADSFSADMDTLRVPTKYSRMAANFFRAYAMQPLPHVVAEHTYSLRGFDWLTPGDRPFVDALLNDLARADCPSKVVRIFLSWYGEKIRQLTQAQAPVRRTSHVTIDDLSDTEFAIVESRAESDRQAGLNELRRRWGNQFSVNMRAVHDHVAKNLTAAQRTFLETAVAKGGVLLANHPDTIEALYREAVAGAIDQLRGGGHNNLGAEITEIERVMRVDRRRYNNDEVMQARYRELIRLRDGG
ncbi:hypothetical protein NH8B_1861 [Pseudogulbenkiania sp. NH8B]|uniref:hypothetical protein n=1 Tax=Pseudogulbenkiania sp. (strain NH8B) TaxID=748280 RepID=UPI0002279EE6|nr:hypothetical protein [Pseudogulbenkiania sp. NH8B]BAK76677.1 hypothetical protein NH8B_1861 [Pseudogulbenkiania sp. NH8B]